VAGGLGTPDLLYVQQRRAVNSGNHSEIFGQNFQGNTITAGPLHLAQVDEWRGMVTSLHLMNKMPASSKGWEGGEELKQI
jgi:hypothetical protein